MSKKKEAKLKEKNKGPETRKPADPKRKDESKRILYSKIREIRSQESLLLFMFVESQENTIEEEILDGIWEFMEFLKSGGYRIIRGGKNGRERDDSNQLETL